MEPIMTPLELLLDDESQLDEAGSHAEPAPKHRLMAHFEDELRAYSASIIRDVYQIGAYSVTRRGYLALGGIRRIYWLALGQGETTIATYIANWWAEHHNEHGLGVLIV